MNAPSQTVGSLRAYALRALAASPTPVLDADLLLSEATGHSRAVLIAFPETAVPADQAQQFLGWIERAAAGEPVAYILGRRGFYDLDLQVTPAVLIPRPETELLLERALEWARLNPVSRVVDVGTGSGALGIALARQLPTAEVFAIDLSPAALQVARENAARYRLDERITFVVGDLLAPAIERGLAADLIVANLPYIPTQDALALPVSQFEPMLALDGGPDGLRLIERLLVQLPAVLRRGGLALLEIGAGQGDAVLAAVNTAIPSATAVVLPDLAGHDRIVQISL